MNSDQIPFQTKFENDAKGDDDDDVYYYIGERLKLDEARKRCWKFVSDRHKRFKLPGSTARCLAARLPQMSCQMLC